MSNQKSKPLNEIVETYVYHVLDSTSRNNQTSAYTNLLLKSLIDHLEFINKQFSLSVDFKSIRRFVVYRDIKSTNNYKPRGITPHYLERVIQIAAPSHLLNPFKGGDFIKNRNFIIVMLFFETGIRIGELMSLTVDSVSEINHSFYLEVSDKHVVNDTRFSKGKIKNNFSYRHIAISKELFLVIQHYISSLRGKLHCDNNLLLVSWHGRPLSKHSIHHIFDALSKTAERKISQGKKLVPHDFRYAFANNFLSYLIGERGISIQKAMDELRVIMGWSIDSPMPQKYASDYIQLLADRENILRINASYKDANIQFPKN